MRGSCVGTTTTSKDLTITGPQPLGYPPPTLDAADQGTVLTINEGVTVTINALTVSHGQTDNPDYHPGGGIDNSGTLTLSHSTVSDSAGRLGAASPIRPP